MDEQGLYGCNEVVIKYYQDEKYLPYIVCVDDKIAGGVGQFIVNSILDKHKGKWDLCYIPNNLPAVKFWLKVIGKYTGGKNKMIEF